tara:strand:+ start:850 stop:1140 length:291 start_codon:yes stop_codon:yes gene_type:complete
MIKLLVKDFPYLDENAGHSINRANSKRPGFFSGSYHIITETGTLIPGAGTGMAGCVGIILFLLKDTNKLEYDFILGRRETFKKEPPEKEFEEATCF